MPGMLFDFGQEPAGLDVDEEHLYSAWTCCSSTKGGAIVNIAHDTVPHSEEVLSSAGPVRFVSGAGGGHVAAPWGYRPGDIVRHEAIGNMQVSGQRQRVRGRAP